MAVPAAMDSPVPVIWEASKLDGSAEINVIKVGEITPHAILKINELELPIAELRKSWMATSTALEAHQTAPHLAKIRAENTIKQPLKFEFPKDFDGSMPIAKIKKIKAAVLREKGSNSEREMAYAMDLSGFEVRDVHMTDLIEGRENLAGTGMAFAKKVTVSIGVRSVVVADFSHA